MFKKIFEFGIILGIIAMFMVVGSYLMTYNDINAHGINLGTMGIIGIVGVVIAVPTLIISAVCHFSLVGIEPKKIKMTEKIVFWNVSSVGSFIIGLILVPSGYFLKEKASLVTFVQPEILILAGFMFLLFGVRFIFRYPALTEGDFSDGEEITIISLFKVVTKKEKTIYFYEVMSEYGKRHLFECEYDDLIVGEKYQMEHNFSSADK